jgi:hypothetical protein
MFTSNGRIEITLADRGTIRIGHDSGQVMVAPGMASLPG